LKMPFREIDVDRILEEKFKVNPHLEKEFREAEEELDIIAEITKVRKELGLTQEQVAQKAGVAQQVVSRLENREHSPNLRNLIKISKALDLKLRIVK